MLSQRIRNIPAHDQQSDKRAAEHKRQSGHSALLFGVNFGGLVKAENLFRRRKLTLGRIVARHLAFRFAALYPLVEVTAENRITDMDVTTNQPPHIRIKEIRSLSYKPDISTPMPM